MTAHHRLITVLALTATLALTGCTAPEVTTTPAPSPAASRPAVQSGTPGGGGDFATLQSQREAVDAATRVMGVVVAHKDSYDAWWGALAPLLSADAAVDWEYTDPARITSTQLTDPAHVTDAPSSTQVFVDVPTDAGIWRLELVRLVEPGAGATPWTVHGLRPPETNSTPPVG